MGVHVCGCMCVCVELLVLLHFVLKVRLCHYVMKWNIIYL